MNAAWIYSDSGIGSWGPCWEVVGQPDWALFTTDPSFVPYYPRFVTRRP